VLRNARIAAAALGAVWPASIPRCIIPPLHLVVNKGGQQEVEVLTERECGLCLRLYPVHNPATSPGGT